MNNLKKSPLFEYICRAGENISFAPPYDPLMRSWSYIIATIPQYLKI